MKLLHRLAWATAYLALVSGLTADATGANNGATVAKSLYGTTASNISIDQYTLTECQWAAGDGHHLRRDHHLN